MLNAAKVFCLSHSIVLMYFIFVLHVSCVDMRHVTKFCSAGHWFDVVFVNLMFQLNQTMLVVMKSLPAAVLSSSDCLLSVVWNVC